MSHMHKTVAANAGGDDARALAERLVAPLDAGQTQDVCARYGARVDAESAVPTVGPGELPALRELLCGA